MPYFPLFFQPEFRVANIPVPETAKQLLREAVSWPFKVCPREHFQFRAGNLVKRTFYLVLHSISLLFCPLFFPVFIFTF